ncbi:MAG: hypothetical protein V4659_04045 [Pseudomonadota bacterium]
MTDWQLIGTAPKDGTPIILADWDQLCLISGCPHLGAGYWHIEMGEWVSAGGSDCPEETPTHWAPLRAPVNA